MCILNCVCRDNRCKIVSLTPAAIVFVCAATAAAKRILAPRLLRGVDIFFRIIGDTGDWCFFSSVWPIGFSRSSVRLPEVKSIQGQTPPLGGGVRTPPPNSEPNGFPFIPGWDGLVSRLMATPPPRLWHRQGFPPIMGVAQTVLFCCVGETCGKNYLLHCIVGRPVFFDVVFF